MVQLQLTLALCTKLLVLSPGKGASPSEALEALRPQLRSKGKGKAVAPAAGEEEEDTPATVDHEVLQRIVRQLREAAVEVRLAELLRLTDVYAPPLPARKRSKELEAILAAIQLRNEALEYSKMTSLASSLQTPSALPHSELDRLGNRTKQSVQDEWKEINQQISAIVNVGFSMFAVGTGVWWVSAGSHYTPRLLLSITGAFLIMLVESFLYYRFFNRKISPKVRHLRKTFTDERAAPTEEPASGVETTVLKFEKG